MPSEAFKATASGAPRLPHAALASEEGDLRAGQRAIAEGERGLGIHDSVHPNYLISLVYIYIFIYLYLYSYIFIYIYIYNIYLYSKWIINVNDKK